MGETRVQFEIYGPEGKSIKLEALVDTAATFTKVPESVAVKLGLKAQYEAEVELGDGRILKRRLALAEVEIEGVRRPVLVAIGGEGERALLGYTTLEILGFKVNPVTGKLEKAVAIEYQYLRIGNSECKCEPALSLAKADLRPHSSEFS
jgi:clan AA aspartic protease